MNGKVKKHTVTVCECAMMIALAFVLDFISKTVSGLFPNPWVAGGGISIGMLPIVFLSLRCGNIAAFLAGLVYAGIQMATGLYLPGSGIFSAVLCILLDYVLAFAVLGLAKLFADTVKGSKLFRYGFGAFSVCMLRFACSFLSGAVIWGEYGTNWGIENIWLYSFCYNISYMLPNAIITAALIVALCSAIDPVTLKRAKKAEKNISDSENSSTLGSEE